MSGQTSPVAAGVPQSKPRNVASSPHRTDPASYGLTAGMQFGASNRGGTLQVERNTISGAYSALLHNGVDVVIASDLVIDRVSRVAVSHGLAGALSIHNSDITNFFHTHETFSQPFAAGALSCNWWGDPAGPAPLLPPDPVWIPWSVGPVANGAGGACTGN